MTRYRGTYETEDGRYIAKVSETVVGTYTSEIEAAYAYDIAAEAMYGEAAIFNFPALRDEPVAYSENRLSALTFRPRLVGSRS